MPSCTGNVRHIGDVNRQLDVAVGQASCAQDVVHILAALGVDAEQEMRVAHVPASGNLFRGRDPWLRGRVHRHFRHQAGTKGRRLDGVLGKQSARLCVQITHWA